jgi:hypothetical protein
MVASHMHALRASRISAEDVIGSHALMRKPDSRVVDQAVELLAFEQLGELLCGCSDRIARGHNNKQKLSLCRTVRVGDLLDCSPASFLAACSEIDAAATFRRELLITQCKTDAGAASRTQGLWPRSPKSASVPQSRRAVPWL